MVVKMNEKSRFPHCCSHIEWKTLKHSHWISKTKTNKIVVQTILKLNILIKTMNKYKKKIDLNCYDFRYSMRPFLS